MMGKGNGRGISPSTSTSAFFANVPYTTTAGYLRKIFSRVGQVQDVELYTDTYGNSIGAGVVLFASAAAASRAVSELHDVYVDGRAMLVKPDDRWGQGKDSGKSSGKGKMQFGKGNPQATVFFNGVPYETTEGFLRSKFERCGNIVNFSLWRRPDRSSHGMGTCEFTSHTAALSAISILNGAIVDGRRLLVQMDSRPEDGAAAGKSWRAKDAGGDGDDWPDRHVFWSNAPVSTTEGYLRGCFEKVGTIVDFDFWRGFDGRSLGRGVCEFDHVLGAKRAIERLHGVNVDGNLLQVKPDGGGKSKGGKNGGKGAVYRAA